MAEYINRDTFLEQKRAWYCKDCNMRKNSKGKTVYEIVEAPCRACDIGDVLDALEDYPAADVVKEENILKFYYVRSIDEYWIGRRIDNFYYAEYDPESCRWIWTHSRYLPWGKHIVSPTSLWKEHTYPSEPEEIPFEEWLQGFVKKHAADVAERKPMAEDVEEFVARLRDFAVELRKAEDALLVRDAADAIEELSEERKTGRWIPVTVSSGRDSWQCSICGRRARGKVKNLPYCHCGAKMEEPEDV